MGQVFSQLTNPGTALQDQSGQTQMVGNPQQVLNQFYKQGAQENASLHPGPTNFTGPHIGTPTFQQAASAGAAAPGGPNAASPALTKAGKLAVLLTSGLQGAMAGRAASEQAVIQSGGHRSGGIGTGFEAGYQLPWQRAQMQNQVQQGQAQTELLKAQSQMIPTPYGQMPAGLAKVMFPALINAGGKTQAAQITANAGIQKEQIGQRFKVVPNVGLFDTTSNQVIPGTQQGITITPEIAKDYQLPDTFVGKPMSLQNLASVQRSSVFENMPEMTAQGPIVVNRRNATATPVTGPGGQTYQPTAVIRPVQVGDPDNPGQTIMVQPNQAYGKPGTQSASVQVPKKAAAAEVPTKIGDQRVAFTTMIQHAELLRDASKALANGDVQTLNGLKNAFKNEFGYAGPITAKAIADAYGGEVTNVISKGHITDAEMAKTGKSLDPSKQNFETVDKVLTAYQALAQSKMNMLSQQEKAAVNASQPQNKQGGGKQGVYDPTSGTVKWN